MKPQYAETHADIARRIRLAKQRLFHDHRKGKPLAEAAEHFVKEVYEEIADQSARLGEPLRVAPGIPSADPSPSREQNDLADAIAEIVTNDAVPPGLRDPVVNYITDGPPHPRHMEDPPPAEDSERDRKFEQRVEKVHEIEALAKKSIFFGDEDQQLALLRMLQMIVDTRDDSYNLAFNALMTVFRGSDALIDEALELLLKAKAEQGGDA